MRRTWMQRAAEIRFGWAAVALSVCCTWGAQAEIPVGPHRAHADVYAAGSGKLLYREMHLVMPGAAAERWVVYQCADGQPFARKYVRTQQRAAVPDFAFEDGRNGYREGVRGALGQRIVYLRESGRSETSRALQVPADGVIDAGFDEAVRANWDGLMRGKAVRLQFLIPSRLQFYAVRVQRIDSIEWHGQRAERLRMRLDTWFGFAIPEVTLVYARDDRRLLEFAGTGNIREARGGHPQVRIAFQRPPQAASPNAADALPQLPLSGRCNF